MSFIPKPQPEGMHRDDMTPMDALHECWELWAGGAWPDTNAEPNLSEVMAHLGRLFQPPSTAEAWAMECSKRRAAAAEEETLAVLLVLAQMAREEFPEAKGIQLEDSDQGDYYCIASVLDADGEDLDEDCVLDGSTGYVYSLDDSVFDTIQAFCTKDESGMPRAWQRKYGGIADTVLDIDAILAGIEPGGLKPGESNG